MLYFKFLQGLFTSVCIWSCIIFSTGTFSRICACSRAYFVVVLAALHSSRSLEFRLGIVNVWSAFSLSHPSYSTKVFLFLSLDVL